MTDITSVYLDVGIVTIGGAVIDAKPHAHRAIQVVLAQPDSVCVLNKQTQNKPFIIAGGVEHQLQMAQGWLMLIEPKSTLGTVLMTMLANRSFASFSCTKEQLAKLSGVGNAHDVFVTFSDIFELPHSAKAGIDDLHDARIKRLLAQFELCLGQECLKPKQWRASAVAQQLSLSESRFLHLFREEMAIAWRPYLLWRRLLCALQAMLNGNSATAAAYISGFSDSAHLSRYFRKTFGMTIREAQKTFKK